MDHTLSESTIDGFDVVVLTAPDAGVEAAFAPGAGMVGCSLRHRGDELLGQRKGLSAYAETGSSMGIPILHPWANRLDGLSYRAGSDDVLLDPGRMPLRLDPNGLPIHGVLAASRHWEVVDRSADGDRARLVARLDFGQQPDYLAAFPFPHVLTLRAELAGARLEIAAELEATGVVPVPVAFGFHPYLRLPGVPRAEWEVALPVRRRARLDDRGIPAGGAEPPPFTAGPLGHHEFDDLFTELDDDPVFTLAGGGRRIEVEFLEGYPVAQVYGGPGDDFICFEPMTAPTNALVTRDGLALTAPGETYVARFAVTVSA